MLVLLLFEVSIRPACAAGQNIKGDSSILKFDDPRTAHWDQAVFKLVKIPSPVDGKIQQAYFYKSKSDKPQPLIISLHTWSGNYTQTDDIATLAAANDDNYIHPDFRGNNNTPEACGSLLTISDIDASIDYVLAHVKVDTNKIYVIGVSGGGFATLNMLMRSRHRIRKFSSWAAITDLVAWYKQCNGKVYAGDIYKCTESTNGHLNIAEAKSRSPFFAELPPNREKDIEISIYAGLQDELVPFTQSVKMYNKLLYDFGDENKADYVSMDEIKKLTDRPMKTLDLGKIADRRVFLRKHFKNIQLVIYQGKHEMLTNYAFEALYR